jgi:hypothetical protein
VGTVFAKQQNALDPVTGLMTQTQPKINVGQPDTYEEFAGVTVRDQEPIASGGQLRLQNTGIGLAQVTGPVKAGDSVGIKQDIDTLAGDPDVPVGIVLQDVAGPVDDPDTKLVRVHFGAGSGGGKGSIVQCKITTLYGVGSFGDVLAAGANYFGVKLFDSDHLIEPEFKVAKSIPARMPKALTIEGAAFNYSYVDDNNRLSSDPTPSTEKQVLCQMFNVGDTIYAAKVDHTGVFEFSDASPEIKYIEMNTEREWVRRYLQQ